MLYTNDTQRLYGVCMDLFNVVTPQHQDSMAKYMGKIHALFHEFNELMPLVSIPAQEIWQRS